MVRLAAFVLAWMMMAAAPAGADSLSPQAFTDAVAAAATAAMPGAKVAVTGDLQLETRDADGETTATDLHNAYLTYLADPSRIDDVIRRRVGALVETVALGARIPPPDRSRIVPVLKPTAWVDTLRAQRDGAPATQLLSEPFNAELAIVYAEDRPSSLRFLMARDDVGDRAKLRDLALGNLNRLLPKIQMRAAADGVFVVEAGGTYEASLLLADEMWSSGQFDVNGDIVVAVPARDALLVTGSRNRTGIARMRQIAAEVATGPYALTPALFVYRDGKFKRFGRK